MNDEEEQSDCTLYKPTQGIFWLPNYDIWELQKPYETLENNIDDQYLAVSSSLGPYQGSYEVPVLREAVIFDESDRKVFDRIIPDVIIEPTQEHSFKKP